MLGARLGEKDGIAQQRADDLHATSAIGIVWTRTAGLYTNG